MNFSRLRSHLTYANVVASLALFLALGGVGYAAATIGSGQIKDNTVRSKDIRNKTVVGKDVKDNALGSAQVKESALGKVPMAQAADTAARAGNATVADKLDGLDAAAINFNPVDGPVAFTEVLNFGGLVLRAECRGADNLHVQADTTVADAIITSSMVRDEGPGDTPHAVHDPDFNPGDNLDILDDAGVGGTSSFDVGGTLTYSTPTGVTVTATFQADEVPFGTGDGCLLRGTRTAFGLTSELSMKRVLVTGSAGHLGEALMRTLRSEGREAVGVDLLESPFTDVVGSIADRELVRRCLDGVGTVLHAATLHKPHVGSHPRSQFVETNITGTLNLLEEAVSGDVESSCSPAPPARSARAGTAAGCARGLDHRGHRARPEEHLRGDQDGGRGPVRSSSTRRQSAVPDPAHVAVLPRGRRSRRGPLGLRRRNLKANEYLYRRVDLEDVVSAHLLAAGAGSNDRLRQVHRQRDHALHARGPRGAAQDAPSVVRRRYPGYEAEYEKRGWTMFPSIGRVYVNSRARDELGWAPRYDSSTCSTAWRPARIRAASSRVRSGQRATTPSRSGPTPSGPESRPWNG